MAVKFSVTFVDPEDGPKHVGDYSKFSLAKKVIKDQFNKLLDTGDRLRQVRMGVFVLEEDYENTGKRATATNYKDFYYWRVDEVG